MPAGATRLFLSSIDNYFKDNYSFELRVGVELNP